jgi:hypothetical protein
MVSRGSCSTGNVYHGRPEATQPLRPRALDGHVICLMCCSHTHILVPCFLFALDNDGSITKIKESNPPLFTISSRV